MYDFQKQYIEHLGNMYVSFWFIFHVCQHL